MELLEESIKCMKCSKVLEKPVLLPCGHSMCKLHEKEVEGFTTIGCNICQVDHNLISGGFPRVIALEKLIEKQIEHLHLGDEYNSTFEQYKDFSDLLDRFERLAKDPEVRIHEEIGEMKAKIDLRREDLKSQIDREALMYIDILDQYEQNCKLNAVEIKSDKDIETKLAAWKEEMKQWRQDLNTFKKDTKLWHRISDEIYGVYLDLETDYEELEEDVFLNILSGYKSLDINIGSEFDMIKNRTLNLEVKNVSQIIDQNQQYELVEGRTVRAIGIDWSIRVEISIDYTDKDHSQFVEISLNALNIDTDFMMKPLKIKIEYDMMILNRNDENRSIRKHGFKKLQCDAANNDNDRSISIRVIKLKDLIRNTNLYDTENDCFTAQCRIKKICWDD